MNTARTYRYCWEDFPAGHVMDFEGRPVSREAVMLEARPMNSKPHLGLVRSRWTMRNQHEEPVLTMEGWGMFRRRDVATAHQPPGV